MARWIILSKQFVDVFSDFRIEIRRSRREHPSIGFVESHDFIGVALNRPPTVMDHVVVPGAQQNQVVEISRSLFRPPDDVMSMQAHRVRTSGKPTSSISAFGTAPGSVDS
jgi:hypothetical protein